MLPLVSARHWFRSFRSGWSSRPRSYRPRVELLETRDLFSAGSLQMAYANLPLHFEVNQGQTDPSVRYLSRGQGYGLFLSPTEAVLDLQKPAAPAPGPVVRDGTATPDTTAVLRIQLVGANPAAPASAADALPGRANYFLGNNPARWRANVPTFGRVLFHNVYAGIDLTYYGNQRQLEYDFLVAPGADPGAIRMTIQGATGITLDGQGNLVLHTAGGDVVKHAPVLYQEDHGQRRGVPGAFRVEGNLVSFRVSAYDRSRPLVIDPVLSYATYLGGSGSDSGNGIAVDGAGNAYLVGTTASLDFPATPDAFQTTSAGKNDVFVAKVDPTGTTQLYTTYLGGSGDDYGNAIAVDGAGNAYITGSTSSRDFPTTPGAYQKAQNGLGDAFVTKLDAGGATLLYSTYLGGTDRSWEVFGSGDLVRAFQGAESGHAIAVDGAGNAYVTGYTSALDFPASKPLQAVNRSGPVFVSGDAGGSWSLAANGLTGRDVAALVVDPTDPATLYAATEDQGLFKSSDGGANWFPLTNGVNTTNAQAVVIDPTNPATLYAAVGSQFFGTVLKSTDGGASWNPANNGLPTNVGFTSFAFDPAHGSLYVGTGDGRAFKTENGGAGWTAAGRISTSGPNPVTALGVTADGTLLAIVGNIFTAMLFRSANGGTTWNRVNLPLGAPQSLTVDPSDPATAYVGTTAGADGRDVLRSTDGGLTWTPLGGGLPADANSLQFAAVLAVSPADPNTLYAGFSMGEKAGIIPGGIYQSSDGGATWSFLGTGSQGYVRALAISPDGGTVYAGVRGRDSGYNAFVTELAPTGASLVFSTYLGGNGSDWGNALAVDASGAVYVAGQTTSTDLPVTDAAVQPSRAGSSDAFVARIGPSGATLDYLTYLGGGDEDIATGLALDGFGNIYVTGSTRSADFPVTPGAYQTKLQGRSDAFVTKLNSLGTAAVYSTYLGGSDNSPDFDGEGAKAIAVDGAGKAYITGIAVSADFPLRNPVQADNRTGPASRTTDGGATWELITNGLAAFQVTAFAVAPSLSAVVYAGTSSGVFRSDDGGDTWSTAGRGLPANATINTLLVDPADPDTAYAGTSGRSVFKTTDGGATWNASTTGIPSGATIYTLVLDPTDPGSLYAGTSNGVYRSDDGGATWTAANTGLSGLVTALGVVGPTLYAGTSFSGLFKSTDGGAHWSALTTGLPTTPVVSALAIDPNNPDTVYFGTSQGVLETTDGGDHFSLMNLGLPANPQISALLLDPADPTRLYVHASATSLGSAIGPGGVFTSGDGAATWTLLLGTASTKAALAIDPEAPGTLYVGTSLGPTAFVAELNARGDGLVYATYLGGSGGESGNAIAVDANYDVYVTGRTGSTDYPVTAGAFQPAAAGGFDAFLAKIQSQPGPATHFEVIAPPAVQSGTPFDLLVFAADDDGNVVPDYAGTVTFTSSDGDPAVVLPANYTFTADDRGVALFAGGVTLVTAGDQTVSVADVDTGMSGDVTVTVTDGGARVHHRSRALADWEGGLLFAFGDEEARRMKRS